MVGRCFEAVIAVARRSRYVRAPPIAQSAGTEIEARGAGETRVVMFSTVTRFRPTRCRCSSFKSVGSKPKRLRSVVLYTLATLR
jgi:hypothetical protein